MFFLRLQQNERTVVYQMEHSGGGNRKTHQRVISSGGWAEPDRLHRVGFSQWQLYFSRFLRLLPDAAPLRRHGNRQGVLRQEEAELGGLSQGPAADWLPLVPRGAAARRVSAEAKLGWAGLGRRRGRHWWRRRQ